MARDRRYSSILKICHTLYTFLYGARDILINDLLTLSNLLCMWTVLYGILPYWVNCSNVIRDTYRGGTPWDNGIPLPEMFRSNFKLQMLVVTCSYFN